MKKLILSILSITLLLTGCGTDSITADYDKVAEKVYKIGELLGKADGDFRQLTLAEDDVEYSDEIQDYSSTIAYLKELEEAYKSFGGNIPFNADLALAKILLLNNGQPKHITKSFEAIYEKSFSIIPEKYQWYFEFGYQLNLTDQLLVRFEDKDGYRAAGEDFSLFNLDNLLQNISPDLSGGEKRAMNKLIAFNETYNLTADQLAEINEILDDLLKIFSK